MKKILSIFILSLALLAPESAFFAAEDISGNEAFVRGIGYARKSDYENARKEFEAALAVNPDLAAAREELAKSFEALKDYDNALAQYKIIISKMPYATDAYLKIADIYMQNKDKESAIKALNEALALNPASAGLHEKLGIIYYDEGEMRKAIEEFQ